MNSPLDAFEITVLDRILRDAGVKGEEIRTQLPFISSVQREHTGAGLYVNVELESNAPRCSERKNDNVGNLLIEFPKSGVTGGALLHLTAGLLDYIEFYSYGNDWPKDTNDYVIHGDVSDPSK